MAHRSFPYPEVLGLLLILTPSVTQACMVVGGAGPLNIGLYLFLFAIPILSIEYYALWRLMPKPASLLKIAGMVPALNLILAILAVGVSLLVGIPILMIGSMHPFFLEAATALTLIPLYYLYRNYKYKHFENAFSDLEAAKVRYAVGVANAYVFALLGVFMAVRFIRVMGGEHLTI